MKLLSVSFLLILLSCAFLLSRASGGQERASPKETEPKSKQSPLKEHKTADQLKSVDASPDSLLSKSSGANPNQIATKPETREQKTNSTHPADSNLWFNALIVFFTGVLAGLGV